MKKISEYRLFINNDTAPDVYQFWQSIPQNDRRTIVIQALRSFMKNYPDLIPENSEPNMNPKKTFQKRKKSNEMNPALNKNKSQETNKAQDTDTPPMDRIDEEDFQIMKDLSNAFGPMK